MQGLKIRCVSVDEFLGDCRHYTLTTHLASHHSLDGPVIAYDISRLFIGPLFSTPRGIDRVDLALAREVFADPDSANQGILPTPWGVRAYPSVYVRRMLDKLEHLWCEHIPASGDPILHQLIAHFSDPAAHQLCLPFPSSLTLTVRFRRVFDLLRATTLKFGRSARREVPKGAIYLNVGQLGLAIPAFHYWLKDRPDVTCALMLHDVIPIEHPHLVSTAAVAHHARMVRTVARHADCLIFNSAHAQERINDALRSHGRIGVPSVVRWLPLPAAFAEAVGSRPELAETHYFIVVSTIEPRKNHDLLIRVWRRLIKRMGAAAPHLIIVGARGYRSAETLEQLELEPLLRSRIHVISGLSSPGLADLVLGAAAMLSPSFVEGFGLPVLEANAMGVTAIVSDIAAHREISGPATILLPVDDECAWEQAILQIAPVGIRSRPAIPSNLTEGAYCADLLAFLKRSAGGRV